MEENFVLFVDQSNAMKISLMNQSINKNTHPSNSIGTLVQMQTKLFLPYWIILNS